MKRCDHCFSNNPDIARFCMQCGKALPEHEESVQPDVKPGGVSMFVLSLTGSVLVSLVLVFVFNLPIFFLAGFLPLLWVNRKK
jgi:hypothetical protein